MAKEKDAVPVAGETATRKQGAVGAKSEEHQMVYVGPPIRSMGLAPYMVFLGGIPSTARGNKTVERLFVPMRELNRAMEETRRKGSMLHTFYRKALKEG